MATVENLCKSAFLLNKGEIIYSGKTSDVINKYREEMEENTNLSLSKRINREGNGKCKLAGIEFRNEENNIVDFLVCGRAASIKLSFEVCEEFTSPISLSLGISSSAHIRVAHLCMKTFGKGFYLHRKTLSKSPYTFQNLSSIKVNIMLLLLDDESGQILDWVTDAFVINILQADFYGTGMVPSTSQSMFLMEHSFSF